MTTKHETVATTLKRYKVDKGMVSTLNWLNGFQGVYTLWSCEGKDDDRNRPYVMFLCWDNYDLQKICAEIQLFFPGGGIEFANLTVENYYGNFRYILKFNSIQLFKDWKNRMNFSDL